MRLKDIEKSNNGFKIGDFVLISGGKFGRIIKMSEWVYDENDWEVKHGSKKIGEVAYRYCPIIIQTMLNSSFERPKRKSASQIYEYQIIKIVSKAFVKKMFKNINDTIVYIKMINEQEGITNE